MNTNTDTTTDELFTDCPACDGELQRQDFLNLTCLDCGDNFVHYERSTGTHVLQNMDSEAVETVESGTGRESDQ